jgi:hypothetical protein
VPENAKMPEPLLILHIGQDKLRTLCELADGTIVPPGSFLPYLGDSWIERFAMSLRDRKLNLSVTRRLFTGPTRRAVLLRDRECYHPCCDLPADKCEVDHIQPHSAGGLTTDDNGRPACGYHNRLRHRPPQPP